MHPHEIEERDHIMSSYDNEQQAAFERSQIDHMNRELSPEDIEDRERIQDALDNDRFVVVHTYFISCHHTDATIGIDKAYADDYATYEEAQKAVEARWEDDAPCCEGCEILCPKGYKPETKVDDTRDDCPF